MESALVVFGLRHILTLIIFLTNVLTNIADIPIPQLQGPRQTYDFSKSLSGCFDREELSVVKNTMANALRFIFAVKGYKRSMISKSVMNQTIHH